MAHPHPHKTQNTLALRPGCGHAHTLTHIPDLQYYSEKGDQWPSAEAISSECGGDAYFLCFYKEMAFRHLFLTGKPRCEDRLAAWEVSGGDSQSREAREGGGYAYHRRPHRHRHRLPHWEPTPPPHRPLCQPRAPFDPPARTNPAPTPTKTRTTRTRTT